ncbi:hypothetical protein [Bacillus sp. JCM 19041]|uniref:hypothetical protein n=1 Tax=Bacillus sp. JCM 19041 TaxID=1460637 RepID=UPI0006D04216
MNKVKGFLISGLAVSFVFSGVGLSSNYAEASEKNESDLPLDAYLIEGHEEVLSVESISYEELEYDASLDSDSQASTLVNQYENDERDWFEVTSIDETGEEVVTIQTWNHNVAEGTTQRTVNSYILQFNDARYGDEWRTTGQEGTNRTVDVRDKSPNAIVQQIASYLIPGIGFAQAIYDFVLSVLPEDNLYITEHMYISSDFGGFSQAFVVESFEESTRNPGDFLGYNIAQRDVIE